MKGNILITIAGLLTFLSSTAIANTSTGQYSLEKMIQANIEQKRIAEAKKFDQLIALAGDKQDELMKSKGAVTNAYQKWHDLKSAIEAAGGKANSKDFKEIELAAQAYSEANKAFIELQKEIVTRSRVSPGNQAAYLVVLRHFSG